MSSGAWLDIDLLRQRREQFGHQRPQVVPVRTLLLRGSLLGAALPLMLLLVCGWFWVRKMALIQTEQKLTPLAQKHDRLQGEIASETTALQGLVTTNKAMAKAMADVRSSSALLGELRRLVPSAVSIDQARINGNVLELDGDALQPNGLRIVNALMLSLGESDLFQRDAVVLQSAQAQQAGGGDQASGERLSYSLTAAFAPDAAQAIRSQLVSLGALGLEQRLQRLQQEEDLLP